MCRECHFLSLCLSREGGRSGCDGYTSEEARNAIKQPHERRPREFIGAIRFAWEGRSRYADCGRKFEEGYESNRELAIKVGSRLQV